jgi:hypothetical protein
MKTHEVLAEIFEEAADALTDTAAEIVHTRQGWRWGAVTTVVVGVALGVFVAHLTVGLPW